MPVINLPPPGTIVSWLTILGLMGGGVYGGVRYHLDHEGRHITVIESVDTLMVDAKQAVEERREIRQYIIEDRKLNEAFKKRELEKERIMRWCRANDVDMKKCPIPDLPK